MSLNAFKKKAYLIILLLSVCLIFYVSSESFSNDSNSIEVSNFYGKYDVTTKKGGQQALSLRGPKIEKWHSPVSAKKTYHIGVSLPHLKDSYWLAIDYGIIDEAKRAKVAVTIVEAGGYTALSNQQRQLRELQRSGVDGIIIGSISYKENNHLVSELVSKGMPVIAMVNDIEAGSINAKALVSFYDMGFYAGESVVEEVEAKGKSAISVLFFPGPRGSGWADETLEGFKAATEFSLVNITIVDVKWGDTETKTQFELIEEGLSLHPEIEYIVGNAVAADIAADILAEKGLTAKIISTYITPPVYDKIKSGRITAAPSDMTVDQARIALDMMVRILNGELPGKDFPFRTGPLIQVISLANINKFSFERLFGPRYFKPIFTSAP